MESEREGRRRRGGDGGVEEGHEGVEGGAGEGMRDGGFSCLTVLQGYKSVV